MWELTSEKEQSIALRKPGPLNLKLSPDGVLLVYQCGQNFFLVDSQTGSVVVHRPSGRAAESAGWSPSGDRVAVSGGTFENVAVFDRSGQEVYQVNHDAIVTDLAYSPDGRRLAIIGATRLQVCDAEDGRQLYEQQLAGQYESVLAFSEDGQLLAYGGRLGEVVICDAASYTVLRKLPCESHTSSIAFRPTGSMLATGHADGKIRLWDAAAGKLRAELGGHGRVVRDVIYSADGRTLLSASMDGTVHLWNVETGRCYGAVFEAFQTGTDIEDIVCRVSLSSNGRRLAIVPNIPVDRKVLLWDLSVTEAD
jgi:WD40 repeat protein